MPVLAPASEKVLAIIPCPPATTISLGKENTRWQHRRKEEVAPQAAGDINIHDPGPLSQTEARVTSAECPVLHPTRLLPRTTGKPRMAQRSPCASPSSNRQTTLQLDLILSLSSHSVGQNSTDRPTVYHTMSGAEPLASWRISALRTAMDRRSRNRNFRVRARLTKGKICVS